MVSQSKWILLFVCLSAFFYQIEPKELRVVCYYTNWSVYRPGSAKFSPQNINPYLCTHLIYAFGGFTKENTLKPFDKYQDIEKGGYAKFTGLKTYNKNLKTMLAIGGWNEGSSRFSPMVASADRRKELVKNVVKFLRQNHFDGLDLDWEYPSFRDGGKSRDRDNYAQLVQELREEFDKESSKTGRPRLLLTMAVPAGIEYINKGYDVPKLMKYLDWMNILSYDYHSAFEPSVNHHAPLYPLEEESEYNYDTELNIDHTIKHYLEAGAISNKLVLGIPTYGRSYTLFNPDSNEIGAPADGPGDMGDATRENGYLAYYEICESVKSDEWTVVQPNENAMGPYAFKDNQWVGYDDEDIVRKKSEYVASHDLGGIMFWAIDNDDFRGTCHNKSYPIIEAAKEALINALGLNENTIKKTVINKKTQGTRRPSGNKNSSRRRQGGNRARPTTTTTEVPRATRRRRPTTKKVVESEPVYKESGSSLLVTPNYKTPEPPTTPDPGGDFKCEDEGFYPHPRDCKKYFWCLSGPSELGIIAHQFTCPAGLYFNKAAASCDYTQNVLCNKKIAKTTTTTPTTTTKKEETTTEYKPYSTPRPLPKITAATSRTTLQSTTAKPDYDDEYEYEDDVEEDDHADSEDPIVIKELLELIKKAGGIEELEKQLNIKDSATTSGSSGSTTPSSISKKLYERVLSRTKLIETTSQSSNSKYKTPNRNSRGPQYKETGEKGETEDKTISRNSRLKYSTINRARPAKKIEDDVEDENEEEEEEEVSEKEVSSTQTGFDKKKYVTLRRNRPSTTAEPELDEEDPDDSVNTITRSSTPKPKSETKSRPNFLRRSRVSTTAEPDIEEDDEDEEEEDEVETVSRRNKASVSSTTRSPYVTLRRSRPTTVATVTEETLKEQPEEEIKDKFNRKVLGESDDREVDEEDKKNYVAIKRTRPTTTTTESTQRYKEIRRGSTTAIPTTEAVTEKEEINDKKEEEEEEEEEEITVIPTTESNSIIKDVTNTYLTTIKEESTQSDSLSSPNTEKLIADSVTPTTTTTSTTKLEITPPRLLEPRPFSINAKPTTDKTTTTTQTVTTTKVSYKPVLRSRPVPAQDSKYKLGINTNEQPPTSTVSSTTTKRVRPETRGFSRFKLPEQPQNYQGNYQSQNLPSHNEPERTFRPDVALDIADLSSLTAVDFSSLKDFSGAPRRHRPRFTTTTTATTTTTTEAPQESIKTGPRTLPLARKLIEGSLSSANKRRTFNKPSFRSNVNNDTSTTITSTTTTEANVSPVKIRPLFKNRITSTTSTSTTETSVKPANRKVIRRFRFSTPSSTTEELTTPSTTTTTTTATTHITTTTTTTSAPTTTEIPTTTTTITSEPPTTIKSTSTTEEASEDSTITTEDEDDIPSPPSRNFLSPITEYVEVPETKPVEEEDENIKLSESNILENSDVSRVNSNSIKGDGEKGYKKVLKRIKPSVFRLNEDFGSTLSLSSEVPPTTTTKPEPSIVVRTRKIIRKLSTTPLTPSEDSLSSTTQASTDLETNRKRKVIRRLKAYSLFDKNGSEDKEEVGKRYQGFDSSKNRKKLAFSSTTLAPNEEDVSENLRRLKPYNLFEDKKSDTIDALTPRRIGPLGVGKKEILSDTITSSTDSSSDVEKNIRLKPYSLFQQNQDDAEHSESITEEIATEQVSNTETFETSTNNLNRLQQYSLFSKNETKEFDKNETKEEEVKTTIETSTLEEKEVVDSVTKKYARRLKPFGLYGKNEGDKEDVKGNQESGESNFRSKFRTSTETNNEDRKPEIKPLLKLKPSLFDKNVEGKDNGLLLKRLQILNPSKYRRVKTTTEETATEMKTETEENLEGSTTEEQIGVTEETQLSTEEPNKEVLTKIQDEEKLTVSVTEEIKTSTEENENTTEAYVTDEIKTSTEEPRMVTEEIRTSTEETLTNLETTESFQNPSTEMYSNEEFSTQLNLEAEDESTTADGESETTTYETTTEYEEEQTTEPRPVYVNKIFKKAQNRPKLNLKQYSATLRTSSTTPSSIRSKSRFESYSRRPIKIKPISPSKNEDNENIGYGEVKPFKKTFTPRRQNNRNTFKRPQTTVNIGGGFNREIALPKYKLSSTTIDPLDDDVSEELEEADYSSEELDSEEENEDEEDLDDDDDDDDETEEINEVTTRKIGLISTTQYPVIQNTPAGGATTKKLRKPNNPYASLNVSTTRSGYKRFTSTTPQTITQNLTDINVDALNERNKKLFNKSRKMNTPYAGPVTKESTLGTEPSSVDDLETTTDSEIISSTMSGFTNEVQTTNEIETTSEMETTSEIETTKVLETTTESISKVEVTTEANATPSSVVTEELPTEIPILAESTTTPQTTTEKQTTLHHIFAEVVPTTTPVVEVAPDVNNKKLEKLIEVNRIVEINGERNNNSETNPIYDHIGVVNRVTEIKVVDGNYSHVTIDGSNGGNPRVKIDINGPNILTEVLSPGNREQRKYEIYGDSKVTNFGTPPTDLLNAKQVDIIPNNVLIDSKSIVKTITPKPLFSNEVSTISLEGLFKTSSPNILDTESPEEELLDTEHSRFVNVKYLEQDDHVSRVFADSKIAPIKILPDGGLTMKAKIVEVTRPSNSGLIKIVPIAVSFEKKSV